MPVRIEPIPSFIAAPLGCPMEAATILTRGDSQLSCSAARADDVCRPLARALKLINVAVVGNARLAPGGGPVQQSDCGFAHGSFPVSVDRIGDGGRRQGSLAHPSIASGLQIPTQL